MQYYYNDADEAVIFGEFLLSSDLLFQFGLMLLKPTAGGYKLQGPGQGSCAGLLSGKHITDSGVEAFPLSGGLSKAAGTGAPAHYHHRWTNPTWRP